MLSSPPLLPCVPNRKFTKTSRENGKSETKRHPKPPRNIPRQKRWRRQAPEDLPLHNQDHPRLIPHPTNQSFNSPSQILRIKRRSQPQSLPSRQIRTRHQLPQSLAVARLEPRPRAAADTRLRRRRSLLLRRAVRLAIEIGAHRREVAAEDERVGGACGIRWERFVES